MQEPASPAVQEPRVFRLIVANASEAVQLIQKKFGTHATVQSVKQHQPKGVSKLWSNPKLEIIVSVPRQGEARAPFQLPPSPTSESEESTKKPKPSETSDEVAMPDIEEVTESGRDTPANEPKNAPEPEPPSEASDTVTSISIEELLLQSGFDRTLVQRLKNLPQWASIRQRSTKQGLTELISLLRAEFTAAQTEQPGPHVAFIGTPGVGKSTVLQKTIANRIFVHGKQIQVLKLDDEDPNPDDLLTVFCEVVGARLVRDPNDLQLGKSTEIYVDLPGVTLQHPERIRHFKSALDELKIQSRVLVMNSLYDAHSLTRSYEIARHLGVTHQTFTHLDELDHWAKLWKFVLTGSYPLIFINTGMSTTTHASESFLPLLISKTFPKILLN